MRPDTVVAKRVAVPSERVDSSTQGASTPALLESFCSHYDQFPEPVLIVNRKRRAVYWNRALEQLLGLPAGLRAAPCSISSLLEPSRRDFDHSVIDS